MVAEACRSCAAPIDVAGWLRHLGLEQHASAFRDNDIDGEVLRRLTGEDLRELGVRSIGHRRRLLDAIAALGAAETPPAPIPTPDAERRHDFRYLLFDFGREEMLDAALEFYEPAVGRCLDRSRIRLYNAACAISFLAYRAGVPPEQKSCGRTLAEDLRWVRSTLARLS